MNFLGLRRQLEYLLKDSLGLYTFSNGASTPAIEIRKSNEILDPNTSVSGLEVIIHKSSIPVIGLTQYSGRPVTYQYRVSLIEWSGDEMNEAQMKIIGAFQGATITPISVPEEIGPSNQAIAIIPANVYFPQSVSLEAA